jgi:hypothetical protein
MGTYNYAEVMDNAPEMVSFFDGLVEKGSKFQALGFNPDTDLFTAAQGRVSNYPTLDDVEFGGKYLSSAEAQAIWRTADNVESINFGNGYVGLCCEKESKFVMVITKELL